MNIKVYIEGGLKMSNFNQTVNGNGNATSLYLAGRDVVSSTTVGNNDIKDLNDQLEKVKDFLNRNEFEDINKDEVLDDIEAIQEQLKSDNPKPQRVKGAIERIKKLAVNIPLAVEGAKLVVDNITNIYDKIQHLF